ncbi:MAG: hypothetical protein EB051_03375 [Chlamydiia bacterium]|nr:hypothetical protein [Chlamydiia bacterium]
MVFFAYGFAVLIFLLFPSFPCLSNTDPSSFSFISIRKSSFNIDQINPNDYIALSECYAARGEDYLIVDEDQNALKDFILSYEYALRCSEQNNDLLFRPLLGAFLVYIRLENIEAATEIHAELQSILSSFCSPCQEALGACKSRNFKEFFTCASY